MGVKSIDRRRKWLRAKLKALHSKGIRLTPLGLLSEHAKMMKGHFGFWLRSLSEFHKAQCFYSIALQIASFVTIYGKEKNRMDDTFPLLISADGILPVATVLYTLLVQAGTDV